MLARTSGWDNRLRWEGSKAAAGGGRGVLKVRMGDAVGMASGGLLAKVVSFKRYGRYGRSSLLGPTRREGGVSEHSFVSFSSPPPKRYCAHGHEWGLAYLSCRQRHPNPGTTARAPRSSQR